MSYIGFLRKHVLLNIEPSCVPTYDSVTFALRETVHDVGVQGFYHLVLPVYWQQHCKRLEEGWYLNGTAVFTSRSLSQVCFHTLRLPKTPSSEMGPRMALPNPTQRFNQSSTSLSTVNLRMYTREVFETWLIWNLRSQFLFIACHALALLTWLQSKPPT